MTNNLSNDRIRSDWLAWADEHGISETHAGRAWVFFGATFIAIYKHYDGVLQRALMDTKDVQWALEQPPGTMRKAIRDRVRMGIFTLVALPVAFALGWIAAVS